MGKERRRKKQQLEGIEPMTSQGYAANLSTKNALLQLPKSYFRFSAKNSSRVLESLQRANFFSDHPLIGSDLKSLIAFFFSSKRQQSRTRTVSLENDEISHDSGSQNVFKNSIRYAALVLLIIFPFKVSHQLLELEQSVCLTDKRMRSY